MPCDSPSSSIAVPYGCGADNQATAQIRETGVRHVVERPVRTDPYEAFGSQQGPRRRAAHHTADAVGHQDPGSFSGPGSSRSAKCRSHLRMPAIGNHHAPADLPRSVLASSDTRGTRSPLSRRRSGRDKLGRHPDRVSADSPPSLRSRSGKSPGGELSGQRTRRCRRWRRGGAKAIWMLRHYKDVARSNLKRFGTENPFQDLEPFRSGDTLDWHYRGATQQTRDTVVDLLSAGLSPLDAAALFWWTRNQLYFDLRLWDEERIRILRYEQACTCPGVGGSKAIDLHWDLASPTLDRQEGEGSTECRHPGRSEPGSRSALQGDVGGVRGVSGALATLNVTPWPLPAVALRPRLSSGDRQEPQAVDSQASPCLPLGRLPGHGCTRPGEAIAVQPGPTGVCGSCS